MRPYETAAELTPETPIDRLVLRRLGHLGIRPAYLCSDEVFVRRAYLDVIGTLPGAQEARQFLLDRSPGKRTALVDALLERDEYVDYWAMRWCDVLRVKSEFPINLWPEAAHAYSRWIRTCVKQNVPYDRFARDLLTASGSNFRVPQANFYRAVQSRTPEAIAQAVALTLMGCHADRWPKARFAGMAAFFSQLSFKKTGEWKEEIVFHDPAAARSGRQPRPAFPDGTPARIARGRDPREVLADWLLAPRNPWFARSIANRLWYWLLGRGIVHEPDDIRPDNPPGNPELLACLEREVAAVGYDLKRVMRSVLVSKTYQLSPIPRVPDPRAPANFACYGIRRLDAEVLIDALNQITGTAETYQSAVPEPFTFIPAGQRSVALPDGSITSAFLEMFGRPARDTGLASERSNRSTSAQRLHMLNSGHVRRKLDLGTRTFGLMGPGRGARRVADALYLTILSRFPIDEEHAIVAQYGGPGPTFSRSAAQDVAWALVNSAEFLYRH